MRYGKTVNNDTGVTTGTNRMPCARQTHPLCVCACKTHTGYPTCCYLSSGPACLGMPRYNGCLWSWTYITASVCVREREARKGLFIASGIKTSAIPSRNSFSQTWSRQVILCCRHILALTLNLNGRKTHTTREILKNKYIGNKLPSLHKYHKKHKQPWNLNLWMLYALMAKSWVIIKQHRKELTKMKT